MFIMKFFYNIIKTGGTHEMKCNEIPHHKSHAFLQIEFSFLDGRRADLTPTPPDIDAAQNTLLFSMGF